MMEKWIADFPKQLRDACQIGEGANLRQRMFMPSDIVVAGLGGSGIGAGIIRGLLKDQLGISFLINQDYELPAFVRPSSLVIVSSFSGNTEESLAMMKQAINKGAEVAAVSSGGKVKEICEEQGINLIEVPPGQPPRTCLGYSMTEQLYLLHHYKLIDDSFKANLQRAADWIEAEAGQIKEKAQWLAEQLKGKLPVLYSSSRWEAVTRRFRQQLNENAKMLCWHHCLPEMTHNELVGWDDKADEIAAVFVHSSLDHPRTAKRIELTKEIVGQRAGSAIDVEARGADSWEQAFYLIHLGDWASYYLSGLNAVDPIEIKVIDKLKLELSRIS